MEISLDFLRQRSILVIDREQQHHGIGLENIRKRLRLLFGNDYTLSITEEEHKFDVLLIIPLLE